MTNAIIRLGHTKVGPQTLYEDLDYWIGPTRIRPKSVYDNNNGLKVFMMTTIIGLHPTINRP
jgi:hypothetical protein